MKRLTPTYFQKHTTLFIAKDLIGKTLVRKFDNGRYFRSEITETEAYCGTSDKANHAHRGKTNRTRIMFESGGLIYVYLIYGRYWMLNVVTGEADSPEAVLIRGTTVCSGPGRLGKLLELDKTFYGEDVGSSNRIWIEDSVLPGKIHALPRVGIDYAEEEWRNRPWRFVWEKEI